MISVAMVVTGILVIALTIKLTRRNTMGLKEDSVAKRLTDLQGAEMQAKSDALGGAFDDGVASVPAGTGGGFTQEQVDLMVASAVTAAQAVDAKALADAQAQAATDLGLVKVALEEMTTKELNEEQAVKGLQDSVAAVQSSLDMIKSIIFPVPVPVPVPAPVQV